MSAPLFPLGQIVATATVLETVSYVRIMTALARHASGNWGCVDPEDAETNQLALAQGDRILSAYPIDPEKPCAGFGENCLWIITEADRSVTTILLPSEY